MAEEVGVGVSGADREDVFRYPVKGSTPTALRISREDPPSGGFRARSWGISYEMSFGTASNKVSGSEEHMTR